MPQPSPRFSRPPPAGPGTSPRGRRRRVARTTALVCAALAGAVALGGRGTGARGGADSEGDGAAGAPEAKVLGQVAMPEVGELTGAMGMWTTERNFVKAELKKIVGYPLGGGSPQWRIPLSGEVCWSSPQPTEEGLIAVLFKNDKDSPAVCTEIGLVDLKKGRLRWQKQARDSYGSRQTFDEVTIGNGTVAAAGTSAAAAWTVGGAPLWKPASSLAECSDEGYAGSDGKLIAVRDCGDTDHPRLEVQTVNPRTRAVTSRYAFAPGTEHVHVVSTDPLVVAADNGKAQGDSGVAEFLSIDDSAARGKLLARISALGGAHGKYEADCPATEVTGCTQLAVSKRAGALYLATTEPKSAGSGAKNDIVAFDLRTGKETGRTAGADAGRLVPIGLDERGQVIAYQESNIMREEGGAVWRIDPATYKKTKLLQNPSATYEMESRFESDRRALYAAQRLYLGADHVFEPSSVYKKKQPLAVVLGTK